MVLFDTRQQNAASCFRVSADDAVTSLALSAGERHGHSSSEGAVIGTDGSPFPCPCRCKRQHLRVGGEQSIHL